MAKGTKTGGRVKGTPNKRTQEIQSILAEKPDGEMPKDFLLRMMRDKAQDHRLRVQCAQAVAPYCHSKMPQITEMSGKDGGPIETKDVSVRDAARSVMELLREAQEGAPR